MTDSAVQAQAVVISIVLGAGGIGIAGDGAVHVGEGQPSNGIIVMIQVGPGHYAIILGIVVCSGESIKVQTVYVFFGVNVMSPYILIQSGVLHVSQVVSHSIIEQIVSRIEAMLYSA